MNNTKVIIPARAGSKRLKDKNKRLLGDIPLVIHSIRYAKQYTDIENIWVNSDDEDILEIADSEEINYLKRPVGLATDVTPTIDVLMHQVNFFESNSTPCSHIILLQPTNPLRPKNLIVNAIEVYRSSGRLSLATFSELRKKFGIVKNNAFYPENYKPGQRSQDLVKRYYENGLLYITSVEAIKEGQIITKDCYPLIIDHPYGEIDIDEEVDLHKAELYLKIYENDTN